MLVLELALRNLFRHKRRNLLSATVVMAGVFALVVGGAFIGGLRENIIRAQEDTISGHVLVRPAGYPTGMELPIDELLVLTPEQKAWLDANTVAWAPRLWFGATAVSQGDSLRVRVIGFDTARDESVFPRGAWKVGGRVPTTAADGVLVSRGISDLLGVREGDRLVLKVRTVAGAINALDLPVAGVFSAGNPVLDLISVFVTADLARELARSGDAVSHVALRLPDREQADAFVPLVRPVMGGSAEVVTWYDEARDILRTQDIRQKALNILSTILLLLAGLGIMNTTLMAAYERVREVGTLRAMGMTRPQVLALFVLEGAMVGSLGGLGGAVVGAALARYWSVVGVDLSAAVSAGGNIPLSTMLYTAWDPANIARSFAIGAVMAAIAATWPAWVASAMEPAEAVRA